MISVIASPFSIFFENIKQELEKSTELQAHIYASKKVEGLRKN